MVEVFKTKEKETIYAVIGRPNKADAYREVAAYKKESLAKVKARFKNLSNGYIIHRDGMIKLFGGDTERKGATRCVIVRR